MRRTLSAFALIAALAGVAAAQAPRLSGGAWSGAYTCTQGITGMTVVLRPGRGDIVDATVIFYAHPDNPDVPSGCYAARGRHDAAGGGLVLAPTGWIVQPGPEWMMTTLDGRLAADGYAGRIVAPVEPNGCTTFVLRRGVRPFKPAPAQCLGPAVTS